MKVFLFLIVLIFVSKNSYSQVFTIDSKGIVKCPNAKVGDKGTIFGDTYEAVDNNLLRQRRDQGVDMTKLCTSLVTNMNYMFTARFFNQPISNWDVSNVTEMYSMFRESSFNQPIGNWNVSNVKLMWDMFYRSPFNQPIGTWDVSNVTDMNRMFYRSPFNQPIGNWDVSKVTDMNHMFYESPFNQPIGNWDVSKVTDMRGMFSGGNFNQPIGNWDVSKVTDMSDMFSYTQFNQPIGNWDVSKVTKMISMFNGTAFNQSISNWDVSNVKTMESMFLLSIFNQPIGNWDVSSVSNMNGMFWSSSFNQSINQWCVINIKTEPQNFSANSPLTSQNKPVWGTCIGLPLKTNLTKPINNVLGSSFKPTFEWETIKDATKYQVQIIEGFDPVVVDTLISRISLSVVKSLKSKTLHNWRVRGYNESKKLFGEWSDVWKFTTKEIPTPSLSLPTNGSLELSGPIELVWSTTQDATSYHVQVSGVNSFSPIFFENTNVTSNSVKLPNLVGGNPVIFFWRVRSKLDSGETGAWSNVWSFTRSKLTSDGDTKELPIQYSLDQNFPNPFNPTTNISFSLPSTVHTRLEVLNVLGQPVSVLVNQTMGSGTHTVSFDGSSLSSGIYLYRLTTPEFTQTRVMSLVK